ncbi:DUF742 domain-containing protein [Streptomyces sp. NPDC088745]|uniref:DUF742 domain-containing protein n=1 Tax=Streptomyces sp. NPDC088745 TaxID=3365884 RepID=UPI0037F419D3
MTEHQRAAEGTDQWYDADAGPLVRPYATTATGAATGTGGRHLDLVAHVTAADGAGAPDASLLGREHQALLSLCRGGTHTVADLASSVGLPTGAVRTLLNDLLSAGRLELRGPARPTALPAGLPLQDVVDALRAL